MKYSKKKKEKFFLIPNRPDSNDFLFYSICYAVCFLTSGKIDTCENKEIEEIIGSDLYSQLNDEKNTYNLI